MSIVDQTNTEKICLLEYGQGSSIEANHNSAHSAFENIALRDPEALAVIQGNRRYSYGEIDHKANCLASKLASLGVAVGDYVAVFTLRSVEMVIGYMAVLKAGGAIIPIDSRLPEERVRYILEISKCKIILTHPDLSMTDGIASLSLRCIPLPGEHDTEYFKKPIILLNSPAAAIFTSGSTGKPKGVVIGHKNLTYLSTTDYGLLPKHKGFTLAQVASISFDVGVGDVFYTLSNQGCLILPKHESDILSVIHDIDCVQITPTALNKISPLQAQSIGRIILLGEPISKTIVDTWMPFTTVFNAYGPTETYISSFKKITSVENLTVGKPLPNTVQYIVDKNLQLVPIGVPGELIIGGIGVALGYLNQPELTAERFIPNHFLNDGSKMYRTGDVCKWTEDGDIQILGRLDDMVKVK
ncbi:hypothetical protein BC833DRAFT_533803, partial [Globomyces pollinis-pini]